jgi:hypothetical protein
VFSDCERHFFLERRACIFGESFYKSHGRLHEEISALEIAIDQTPVQTLQISNHGRHVLIHLDELCVHYANFFAQFHQ